MELIFEKSTDKKHKVVLESEIEWAVWKKLRAPAGQTVDFEVKTFDVGDGAPIEVVGKSEKGKKLGKWEGEVKRSRYTASFKIPEDIELNDQVFFKVKLPKHGLRKESNRIPAVPKIMVTNLKWSLRCISRRQEVKLTADVKGVRDGTEATIKIYEFGRDGSHHFITQFPVLVKNKKIELDWEYKFDKNTSEIPTEEELQKYRKHYIPPSYFFTIEIDGQKFGEKQESGLLEFKDEFEISVKDEDGKYMAKKDYRLILADGKERKGKLSQEGFAREKDIPPGITIVEFPNLKGVDFGRRIKCMASRDDFRYTHTVQCGDNLDKIAKRFIGINKVRFSEKNKKFLDLRSNPSHIHQREQVWVPCPLNRLTVPSGEKFELQARTSRECRKPKRNCPYNEETFKMIEKIAGNVRYFSDKYDVPELAVAGSVAEEYEERFHYYRVKGIRTPFPRRWIDVCQDSHALTGYLIGKDLGIGNINIYTARAMCEKDEELRNAVGTECRAEDLVTYILYDENSYKGTVHIAAVCIQHAKEELSKYMGGYPDYLQEALLVSYFRWGPGMIESFEEKKRENRYHRIRPGDGCRVCWQREKLLWHLDIGSATGGAI